MGDELQLHHRRRGDPLLKADAKYTRVVTRDAEALIRKPIKDSAQALDPESLWRIHRATIVNLRSIDLVQRHDNSRMEVLLAGRDGRLPGQPAVSGASCGSCGVRPPGTRAPRSATRGGAPWGPRSFVAAMARIGGARRSELPEARRAQGEWRLAEQGKPIGHRVAAAAMSVRRLLRASSALTFPAGSCFRSRRGSCFRAFGPAHIAVLCGDARRHARVPGGALPARRRGAEDLLRGARRPDQRGISGGGPAVPARRSGAYDFSRKYRAGVHVRPGGHVGAGDAARRNPGIVHLRESRAGAAPAAVRWPVHFVPATIVALGAAGPARARSRVRRCASRAF